MSTQAVSFPVPVSIVVSGNRIRRNGKFAKTEWESLLDPRVLEALDQAAPKR